MMHQFAPRQRGLEMPAEHLAWRADGGGHRAIKIVNGPGGPYSWRQAQQTMQPTSHPTAAQIAAAHGIAYAPPGHITETPTILRYLFRPQSVSQPLRRNSWTPSYRPQVINNAVTTNQDGDMSFESGNLHKEIHTRAHMYRPIQSCVNGWAGLRQRSFAQTFGGMTDHGGDGASGGGVWPPNANAGFDGRSLILPPIAIPRPTTTGIRSISGVTARGRFGAASNRRLPAIFIPTSM